MMADHPPNIRVGSLSVTESSVTPEEQALRALMRYVDCQIELAIVRFAAAPADLRVRQQHAEEAAQQTQADLIGAWRAFCEHDHLRQMTRALLQSHYMKDAFLRPHAVTGTARLFELSLAQVRTMSEAEVTEFIDRARLR